MEADEHQRASLREGSRAQGHRRGEVRRQEIWRRPAVVEGLACMGGGRCWQTAGVLIHGAALPALPCECGCTCGRCPARPSYRYKGGRPGRRESDGTCCLSHLLHLSACSRRTETPRRLTSSIPDTARHTTQASNSPSSPLRLPLCPPRIGSVSHLDHRRTSKPLTPALNHGASITLSLCHPTKPLDQPTKPSHRQ